MSPTDVGTAPLMRSLEYSRTDSIFDIITTNANESYAL